MTELFGCPFCKGEAYQVAFDEICCTECDVAMESHPNETAEQLRQRWNTRSLPAAQATGTAGDIDDGSYTDDPRLAAQLHRAALASPAVAREAIKEATPAQHFDLPKGRPAQFMRNGVLETCQCLDCRRATLPSEAAQEGVREALKPFAKIADDYDVAQRRRLVSDPDAKPLANQMRVSIAIGDCRKARAALSAQSPLQAQPVTRGDGTVVGGGRGG